MVDISFRKCQQVFVKFAVYNYWPCEKCSLHGLVGYPLFKVFLSNVLSTFCYTLHQQVFMRVQLQNYLSDQQWMGLQRGHSGVQTTWIPEPR